MHFISVKNRDCEKTGEKLKRIQISEKIVKNMLKNGTLDANGKKKWRAEMKIMIRANIMKK